MPAKLKLIVILILSIFATVAVGVFVTHRQPSAIPLVKSNNGQQQSFSVVQQTQDIVVSPERANYKSIPLDTLSSSLQGSDPATLALNVFDDMTPDKGTRKVEVVYPQPNQALVTITQINPAKNSVGTIKYRVEMATFGRSILVTSPPVWEVVWAGSQEQCYSGSKPQKSPAKSLSRCQEKV
ncbi:MAG: hypothetical protein ACHBN1_00645 [Heteroscytonema crispum UTEX LB 1556]